MSIPSIIVLDLTPSIELENWEWDNQDAWRLAAKNWSAFNAQWYGNLDSRLDESSALLDVSGIGGHVKSIIVLQSYLTMFDHVWARAFGYEYSETGFIITGQPGIGVSLLFLLHFHGS